MKQNWKAILAFAALALILGAAGYYRITAVEEHRATPVPSVVEETDVLYIRSPQFHEARAAFLAGDAPVSEAYLMEHVHAAWAKEVVTLFDGVYNQCGVESVSTTTWPNDNTVEVKLGKQGDKYKVKFSKVHYDPELTTFTYGKTQISQQIPTELSGHAYLFDLTQDEAGGTFEQTDTVTLEQHRETTVTKSVEMNYTLSSETTIGGQYAGVSLEEKLTATFGKAFKDEESQAEGESKSVTEEHKFDVDLEPLKATLVILESVEVHSSTPFSIDGVPDWQIDIWIPYACTGLQVVEYNDDKSQLVYTQDFLDWYGAGAWWFTDPDNLDWCYRHPSGTQDDPPGSPFHTPCHLTFGKNGDTIEELTQLFRGTHPRWPGMAYHGYKDGWIEHQGHRRDVWNAWHAMQNPDLRHIELTGVQHRVYENTIKETISDVTGQDLDAVARQHSAETPHYNPK